MKLSTREDIEAPLAFVYAALSDIEVWERAAMRRGAEVTRTDTLRQPGVGMGWIVNFDYRGKPRKVTVALTAMEQPNALGFRFNASSIEGSVALDFVELSARRTRVTVRSELKPRSLTARVLLQSAKLARSKIERKYESRIGLIGKEIEDRYRNSKRA